MTCQERERERCKGNIFKNRYLSLFVHVYIYMRERERERKRERGRVKVIPDINTTLHMFI